jgi:hypothetical protein
VRHSAGLLLAATLLATGRVRAQEAQDTIRSSPRLTIELRRDSTGTLRPPLVTARHVMADGAFDGALRNGFPVRFAFRLSLWRVATLYDRLIREAEWDAVVVLDPVANSYRLLRSSGAVETFNDRRSLDAALGTPFLVDLEAARTSRNDRFYYLATVTIESLSLSELEDVERWLKGDLGRESTNRGDVGNAFSRGARLALIRLSGLPHRVLDARTERFRP